MKFLRQFLAKETGTTSVEYAVMLAMILLVLIAGVVVFGNAQNGYWMRIDGELNSHGF